MHQDDERRNRILATASDWLTRLRGSGDSQTLSEFVAWLRENPEHAKAILDLSLIDQTLDTLEARDWHDVALALERKEVAEAAASRGWPSWGHLADRLHDLLLSRFAAMIASFMGFVFAIQVASHDVAPAFQTQIGERRLIQLPDGSLMHLNTNSQARIEFSDHGRDVYLIRGEALFEVAHDPRRPFEVHMGDVAVRAVGTQFNIHRARNTTVSVFEGHVQILDDQRAFLKPLSKPEVYAQLSEAEEATLRASSGGLQVDVKPMSSQVSLQRRAWTRGLLLIQGESLRHVIEQFNRYHRTQIVLEPGYDGPRLGGTFPVGDQQHFLQLITSLHGLEAEGSGTRRVIYLKRRAARTGEPKSHAAPSRDSQASSH